MNTRHPSLFQTGLAFFLLGSLSTLVAADTSHGQSIYQNNCQRCHSATPDVSRLRCASKVFADTLGNHYADAFNISDADKTDLAAFLATQDAARYSFTGLVTNSSGGIAGVSVVAAGYSLPNVTNVTAANGSFTLSGVRAGDYTVTASKSGVTFNPPSYMVGLATNASGYRLATSTNRTPISPVFITFTTNAQANIYLSPADGTTYSAPALISVAASVYDPDSSDGSVAQIKLYNGPTLLLSGTGDAAHPLYLLTYNLNATTAGVFTVTAVAQDYQGGFTTSAPVNITVTAPVPPSASISLAAGKQVYDNNCSYCHGTPPGGNGGSPYFGLNPIPLYGASRAVIKPGLTFSQGYVKSISLWYDHAVQTVGSSYAHGVSSYPPGSVSNYVNNLMTSDEQSNLAAYIASQNQTYWSFGGFVKDTTGQAIGGATVTLASTYNPGATATTDANGHYLFAGLRQGDYTVSASHSSYSSFYPPSHDIKAASSSAPPNISLDGGYVSSTAPSVDFAPVFSISGSVTNANGRGFQGITIQAKQSTTVIASAVTDASGNYTLPLTNGNYTLSPVAISQYVFTPTSQSATVSANQTGINFGVSSYPPLVITGTIRDSTNQPLAGVTVALDEAPGVSGVTDANGRYSLTNADPGTFTVTPVFGSYVFSPPGFITTLSTSNQTNINFTGYFNSYTINGLVRAPGFFPIVGATVSIPGQSVLSSWQTGGFSLVATNGTYNITVSKPGYIFSPATQTVTVANGQLYGVTFTAYLPITYVAPFGRNTNDGSSWSAAKSSVQAGIDATAPGGQVWVAASRYYELVNFNGISLYGGFAGNESALEQRNWNANLTTLDGNQIVFGQIGKLPGTIVSGSGRIDGFEIVNGLNYTDQNQNYQNSGGGVSFSGVIANNLIHGNRSSQTGGGIFCGGSGSIISNNTVYGNNTSYEGAGIFSVASQVTIVNNYVYGNQSTDRGGGIHVDYGSLGTVVANNVVAGNYAANYSAGIGMYSSSGLVVNNTVVGNVLTNNNGAAGIYLGSGSSTNINNIVAFNTGGVFKETFATALLSNTCVFGNTGFDYSNIVASSSDIASDPQFVNRAGGDYHLLATSPAIDAGNNSFVQGSTDIDGEPRIQGARVDLGADEYLPANILPDVSITGPTAGSTYRDPATMAISATATDSDGTITQLVIFAGFTPVRTNSSSPFTVTVSNFVAGTYSLTAQATDNRGGIKTSAPVSVTVYSPTAPSISLTSPTNGAAFPGPANISISATAQGNSGTVTQVLFYAGTTLIGAKTGSPYSITWSNAVEGNYYLSAVAKDNQGLSATSDSVNILVLNPPTFSAGANFSSDQLRLPISVEAGQRYVLQASSNLVTWTSLVTNQSTGGPYEFIDTKATNFIRRFYRVLVVP